VSRAHVLLSAALLAACGRGQGGTLIRSDSTPAAPPSAAATVATALGAPVDLQLKIWNRTTAALGYAEVIVGDQRKTLPILAVGEAAGIAVGADPGTPLVMRYQSGSGIREDTVGAVEKIAAAGQELALTDIGVILVRH